MSTGVALAALAALVPTASRSATLTVAIADSTGAPLADAVALLEPASGRAAVKPMADVEVAQRKRQFAPRVTLVTTGTRVAFPNFDTVRHHVYSFSPTKTFELKLYAGVPNEPITFDKPGIAVLGCNIHDAMAAWIVVADTPWAARSQADGKARIEGVPPGAYKLRLWHPGIVPGAEPPAVPIAVAGADLEQAARLPVRSD